MNTRLNTIPFVWQKGTTLWKFALELHGSHNVNTLEVLQRWKKEVL